MSKLDPITLEILTEGLISVVREMRATVFRTARSVAIYEGRDYSCALFDAKGQVAAQSEDNGAHVVPMPWTVQAAIDEFQGAVNPGDVIMLNDPYRGGTHLNDVTLIYPVFEGDRLGFFAAVREHWADVGGTVPGSMSGTATEIYQEGVRIPPIKIIEGGRLVKAAIDLILANMRVPHEREGDFQAGVTACKTAERRLRELIARYGMAALEHCIRQNLDRSEARMRAQLARLPDGDYFYEDYLETFPGGAFEPLRLPLKLTIQGDSLVADFTGASPQVPVPVNSTLAVTAAGVIIALKSIFDSRAPLNQGTFRPIAVVAPAGTIVNVQHPAPAGSHGEIRKRVMSVMVGALAQVVPELVAGDTHRTSFHNLIGGIDPRTSGQFVHYEWSSGGNGAFAEGDGPSAMAGIDWGNIPTAQSTEVLESRYPIRVEWSRLCRDGGGDGAKRGGTGLERGVRVLAPACTYSLLSDGAVVPAFGVAGGFSALPVATHVARQGADIRFPTPGKVGGFPLMRDDIVVMRNAGGGGYGDPLARAVEDVLKDVREGYIGAERASERYGVVVRDDMTVDVEKTVKMKKQIAAARHRYAAVDASRALYREGPVSKRRVCPVHPSDARKASFKDDDLIELLGKSAAPLRAWIVLDPKVASGTLPVDEFARGVLGIRAGDHVELRPILIP